MSESNLVQISLEYLLLAVVLFHLARGRLFLELPAEAHGGAVDERGMHVAHQLLRYGARAAALAEDVVLEGAGDADDIHPVVLVEAMIFHGNERLRQILRQCSDGSAGAV